MKKVVLAAAAFVLAAPAFAQDEQSVKMEEVPAAAMEAAKSHANGIEFTAVAMDSDEGTETYELSGKMANGMMLEIDVLADGTLEEVEEQVGMGAVPAPVKAALDQNLNGFQPTEKSTRPGNKVVYEFEGAHDGKDIDVEIDADGSNYKLIGDMAG